MTTTNKILLGGAAALGVGAYFYRSGINHLQFGIDGYVPGPDGSIQMRIKVTNPSALFGYPVPEMFVVVYDSNDNIVGTILNQQLQWISANGISYIYGTVQPNYQNLVSIITSLIQNGGALPTGLTFDGQIRVGRILIPFTTQAGMAGVGKIGFTISKEGGTVENDSIYKWLKIEHGKKSYSFSKVFGKINYVSIANLNGIAWNRKEFKTWDEMQAHYKSPMVKAMILLAEDRLDRI